MKPETEIDETGSFGEPEEKPAPFWKRSVWGISVATWGLCAVVLLAAIWYLFLRAPSETGMPPFNDADAGVQTWQTTQESSPSVQSTETMTVRTGEDMSQLARDVKTELDNRDEKIQATLNMLHDSINKLGEAIKKDEEYAQETRRQLDDIRSHLNGMMTQKSVTESSSTPHPAKKKTSSVLNGMKIMSMETGMAWIRWQGIASPEQPKLPEGQEASEMPELTPSERAFRTMRADVTLFIDILLDTDLQYVFTVDDTEQVEAIYGPVHSRLLKQALDLIRDADDAKAK